MGALAEGIVAYAQPLFDRTDGSVEQLNKAMVLGQLCWNAALLSEELRDRLLCEMRPDLDMDDAQFAEFRRSIIDPMIRRHQDMFPHMYGRISAVVSTGGSSEWAHSRAATGETYPGTQPYAPCPCKSGRKYKFCCRKKDR